MARHHVSCVLAAFSILCSGGCGDRGVSAEDLNAGARDEGLTDARGENLTDGDDFVAILDMSGPKELAADLGGAHDSLLTDRLDIHPGDSLSWTDQGELDTSLVTDIAPQSDRAPDGVMGDADSRPDQAPDAERSDLSQEDQYFEPDIAFPEICDDGLDNDQDGLTDCADPGCDNRACGSHLTCHEGLCQEGGTLVWVKKAGGPGYDGGYSLTLSSNGVAILLCGFEGDWAIFGNEEAGETHFFAQEADDRAFAMYNTDDGTLARVVRSGGGGGPVVADQEGGWRVTGTISREVTLGMGEAGETVLIGSSEIDLFVARYNADTTLDWARKEDGIGNNGFSDFNIGLTSDGGVIVSGVFEGRAIFDEWLYLSSRGESDIFLARYNADGTFAWVKAAGGEFWGDTSTENATGLSVLPDDGALITGYFTDSPGVFGRGEEGETRLPGLACTPPAPVDCVGTSFIARYNADGTLAWAKNMARSVFGYSEPSGGHDISSLPDGGGVATGMYYEASVFGEGEAEETWLPGTCDKNCMFVARYNGDGTLMWAKSAEAGRAQGEVIASLPDGGALVSGYYSYSGAVFGRGEPGQTTLQEPIQWEFLYFLARYNGDGTLAWARNFPGEIYDIEILPEGDGLLTGRFYGTAAFGLGEPGETTLTSSGTTDIFVARYRL